jgi:malonate transporter
MTHVILLALAPVFFVMALGFLAGRGRSIDNHHVGELNALVMDFALPASLFVATASAPRSVMMAQGGLFAVLGFAMLVLYAFWYLIARRLLKASRAEAAVQALTVALPNYAAAGLPIVSAILGPTEVVPVAIAIAAGSILPSPLTLLLLELSGGEGRPDAAPVVLRVGRALRRAFTKPIVLGPVFGIMLSLLGLKPDAVAHASLQLLGQAAGGVALFLTGLILSAQPLRLDWTVAGATVAANIVQPLLVAAAVPFLPISSGIAKLAILLAALPSGFFGILFGVKYAAASAEAGSMVVASTVLSIPTLAIAIAVLYPQ